MEYDKAKMKKMADNLEQYIELIDNYVIIEGLTKEEYDDAVNTVKKLIKKLRKGKGEKMPLSREQIFRKEPPQGTEMPRSVDTRHELRGYAQVTPSRVPAA